MSPPSPLIFSGGPPMRDIEITLSLRSIPRDAWNACFVSEPEDYDYLRAVEDSALAGFAWRYVLAYENGTLIAAMPAFLTDYALDTTLDGAGKKIASMLRSIRPGLLTMKLACLGSPVSEYGLAGFHADVADAAKPAILADMALAFEQHAVAAGYRLLGLKDIPAFQQSFWEPVFAQHGYASTIGLPVAKLPIDFADMDAYFASLSAGTRKDMRRKWRTAEGLRIEQRRSIDDVLPQVMALYRSTRARADMQFEELNAAFFQNILRSINTAFCTLYYEGEELLAFNLLLQNDTTLLDKFFCMDAQRGRAHNLYFISWLTNVAHCITHRLSCYQSGQAGYENKLRLGSTLIPTRMVFKHQNRFLQRALRLAAPLLAADDIREAA
ncbi:MAG: GNAT family N-acetyltransferase [Pseudomonadota bacterium]